MKRKHEDEVAPQIDPSRPAKRIRSGTKCGVFDLSDELLLRFLSYLPILDLTRCERVCRKLQALARDNELWREKFYNAFVRPRARKIPTLKYLSTTERETTALLYSSRAARWLEHSHLVRSSNVTDWQSRYKVKFNWTRGRAKTTDILVGSKPTPIVLAKVFSGRLYTADQSHGLRIWYKSQCVHTLALGRTTPTALTVGSDGENVYACVGCEDGSVLVFGSTKTGSVEQVCSTSKLTTGRIESVAVAWPFLLTISSSKTIDLCAAQFRDKSSLFRNVSLVSLTRFSSESELGPVSLSLRRRNQTLIAGVVYAFNRFNAGWCLGLQELRLNTEGTLISSRATSNVDTPIYKTFKTLKPDDIASRSAYSAPFSLHPQLMRPPNSLSYCGCYILAGLSDNTLMVYTVTSDDDRLEINAGRRLWGHTSAVSAAEVTSTGKALSISAKSDEMRYWELEDLLDSATERKTSTPIISLSSLNDALDRRGNGLGLALTELKHETELIRKVVSFDDEQAIVLGQRGQRQILSCFDFA